MPLGTVTKTANDVALHVKRQFGDESGVQIKDSDILRWINQAQMEIVNKNPMIQATSTGTSVKGQQKYALSTIAPNLLQIESVFYDSCILEPRSFEGVRHELGTENSDTGNPTLWYTWADQLYLWPIPESAGKTIEVNYSAEPSGVAVLSDLLSVPDRYFDRVCEYATAKAYELDEDWQGHQVNAQKFEDKLLEATNAQTVMNGSFPVATDNEYEGW